MPPWRSRSMSSIESAPHTMPATNARILNAALAPPFAAIFTRSRSRAGRPQRSASAITGTSPAHDTRFGSSNRTLIAARAWDSRIQRMPFCARLDVAVVRTSSQLRGAFVCYDAPSPTHFGGGCRLIGRRSRKLCHAFGQLVQTVDLGRERLREMIDLLQARVYRNRRGCACRTDKVTYRARYSRARAAVLG